MRSIAIASLMVFGCASVPDFQRERLAVFNETDALCWASTLPNLKEKPENFKIISDELGKRAAVCSPEIVESGRQRALTQFAREKAITERVSSQNAQTAESVLKGAATIAGIILLAPAIVRPSAPPPQPVTCQWQMNANGTGTAICR